MQGFFDLRNNKDLADQIPDEHKFGHMPQDNPDERYEQLLADLSPDELRGLRNFIDIKLEENMDDDGQPSDVEEQEDFAGDDAFANRETEEL